MKSRHIVLFGLALAALALPAAAEGTGDGYRPQNSAQRNYKACKPEAIVEGTKIVTDYCGALPERPKFPGYDEAWNHTSEEELDVYAQNLKHFHDKVSRYQDCITKKIMADGSQAIRTLNYAACADQGAVEKLAESTEEWGMSCMAYNDSRPKDAHYSQACFPGQ